jgi:hypothetical protein
MIAYIVEFVMVAAWLAIVVVLAYKGTMWFQKRSGF